MGQESTCNAGDETQETSVHLQGREDALEEGMATHSNTFAGESYGERSLVGYRPEGRIELDTTKATEPAHMHAHRQTRIQNAWVQIPVPPLICCVATSRLLSLSTLKFPHL